MIHPVKKIIRASAGTGKTYRLSLEYIGLLLQYWQYGLHFGEILVITFTKKATAEIRERIFNHLHHILLGDDEGLQLRRNLESFFDVEITDKNLAALQDIYIDMLTNKHLVQISTIDSFTNTIFKTIIAPYLGIIDYEVQATVDERIRNELYRSILEDKDRLGTFQSFFERTELKNINDYEQFVDSVIRNRWAFHFIRTSASQRPYAAAITATDELFNNFRQTFTTFARELQNYLSDEHPAKTVSDLLNIDYVNLVNEKCPHPAIQDILAAFCAMTDSEEAVLEYYSLLLDEKKNIWNGSKVLRKKADQGMKEHLTDMLRESRLSLADYLFTKLLLTEERDLLDIVDFILAQYDERAFRDRVFTHDDLSYYTFKHLYDPELSLIEGDYVSNTFYEQLSTYTRFILIDEFQDTSIIQYKILLPIIGEVISGAGVREYGGAIIVGDEKQSIYGWRGGERDLLLNMATVMPEAQQLTLDRCYRSDENIITFVNSIFDHESLRQQLIARNIQWPYTAVRAAKSNGAGYVEFYLRNTARAKENNAISSPAEAIREFLQSTLASPAYADHLRGKTAILARRNADLDLFAAALDELGIAYMQESSNSLLDHRAIKPVYLLLCYLVYGDFYDLLRFLRSDAVLLDTRDLKHLLLAFRDAKDSGTITAIRQSCSHIKAVHKVESFIASLRTDMDPFSVIQKIIEEYNIIGRFTSQSDSKNINQFLIRAGEFHMKGDYQKSLPGFLDYCQKEKGSESFRQVGLEDSNAITLMTIHKSKGLEFDNVFLYWNLSGGIGRSFRQVRTYLQYTSGYREVNDYLLTFNYDGLIGQSSQQRFATDVERRQAVEELNTLYVALSRAKSNLFLCITYQKSGGFENLLQAAKNEKELATLFAGHLRTVFQQNYDFFRFDENRERGHMGQPGAASVEPVAQATPDMSHLAKYLDTDRIRYLQVDIERLEREAHVDFKSLFLEQNAVEIGNLVHYYLSFIKSGAQKEKEFGRNKAISFYGSLMSTTDISRIIDEVDQNIARHPDIFSAAWTHIYTEFTLFAADGSEHRIDRLMVDDETKKIEIIDYKTGHIFEPEQIEIYVDIVRSLPLVQRGDYSLQGRFLEMRVKNQM
ncbi:UvrD-helicase domain-containing protein [candidate division KSB1 bacterium]|nr:UvrD-helicase domain-containing protein [candidate division KSB1 bacterium]